MGEGERHQRGGIGGLYRVLRDHGEALEADLQRVYGVDLRDFVSGTLSWRRLNVLCQGMYGETARWGPTENLLASTVDALRGANWQRAGGKGRRPTLVHRPGRNPGKRRIGTGRYSIEHMQRILDKANREVTDGD